MTIRGSQDIVVSFRPADDHQVQVLIFIFDTTSRMLLSTWAQMPRPSDGRFSEAFRILSVHPPDHFELNSDPDYADFYEVFKWPASRN